MMVEARNEAINRMIEQAESLGAGRCRHLSTRLTNGT